MQQPTSKQLVHERHWSDLVRNKAEVVVKKVKRGSGCPQSQYLISTTKHSQVLIVIPDFKDSLPYNSYSHDPENPWLINGFIEETDPSFHDDMNVYWKNDAKVPVDWKIFPFRVYEWNESKADWVPCGLEVECQNEVVRARVRDQTFWSHPPRSFQVIKNCCKERTRKQNGDRYTQTLGRFNAKVMQFAKVDPPEQIPEKSVPQWKEKMKKEIKDAFNDLFNMVQELPWNEAKQLTSYRYPTIQMEAKLDYEEGATRNHASIRYGGYSPGPYAANDNAVHYRLEKEGTEPVPKPTKGKIWDWHVEDLNIENPPSYEEVCGKEEK